MKSYEKYKSINIDWLDNLPNHWTTIQIKQLKSGEETLFIDGDWIESKVITESGIKYLTTGNIGPGYYKEQGFGFISEDTFRDLNCTEVFPGDLVISRLNEPIGRACIIPELGHRIVTAVDNVILRPKFPFSKRYLLHLMNSPEYTAYTGLISRGATMKRISRGLLGSIKIPFPTEFEQTQIAAFLDYKTNLIDGIIEKKKQLITLLKEKRQAVINEAVIKGLNPNVKMKNSGVEWLGDIPEHWEVKKMKHVVSCNDDTLNDKTEKDLEINYIEIGDVSLEYGIENYSKMKFSDAPSRARRIVKEHDVILSTVRTYLKAITKVNSDYNNFIVSTGFAVLRSKFINPDFLGSIVKTENFIDEIISLSVGVSYPAINSSVLLDISIPLPPEKEQLAISNKINKEFTSVQNVVTKIEIQIKNLQTYRQSLISEAVTGKIDVREWVASQ